MLLSSCEPAGLLSSPPAILCPPALSPPPSHSHSFRQSSATLSPRGPCLPLLPLSCGPRLPLSAAIPRRAPSPPAPVPNFPFLSLSLSLSPPPILCRPRAPAARPVAETTCNECPFSLDEECVLVPLCAVLCDPASYNPLCISPAPRPAVCLFACAHAPRASFFRPCDFFVSDTPMASPSATAQMQTRQNGMAPARRLKSIASNAMTRSSSGRTLLCPTPPTGAKQMLLCRSVAAQGRGDQRALQAGERLAGSWTVQRQQKMHGPRGSLQQDSSGARKGGRAVEGLPGQQPARWQRGQNIKEPQRPPCKGGPAMAAGVLHGAAAAAAGCLPWAHRLSQTAPPAAAAAAWA